MARKLPRRKCDIGMMQLLIIGFSQFIYMASLKLEI